MKKSVAPVSADVSIPLLAGANQVIGGRKYQEDRSVCIADINPMAVKHHPGLDETRRAFFAVFDGFGGDQVAHATSACHTAPTHSPHPPLLSPPSG